MTDLQRTARNRALDELLPRLADLAEADIQRPHADPHAAAATGLLVADWLMQPEHTPFLEQIGLNQGAPKELARAARAIVELVEMLGGDYLSEAKPIPSEIEERGQAVRQATIKELEKALPNDEYVGMWLEAVRRGEGLVDLVYDLRTLAELLTRRASSMPASLEQLPTLLRAASDAIEYALRADEPPELKLARGRLARLWTLFAPAYEYAAAAARSLSQVKGSLVDFPPLALVAANKRAQRRPGAQPARETGSRRAQRALLELEVGIESESNFYVGFTENVSIAGVFVATYLPKPIGAQVEIALTIPGIETMRIHGVVRWQRMATADGWPGMGVDFEGLSKDQEQRIARFLALREPMFYEA